MLIGDEAVTSSGFLETISGRRKQSRWTCQSRKHAENLEFFKNVDWRRSSGFLETI